MSMSVGASSNASSMIQGVLGATAGSQKASDPLDELLKSMTDPSGGAPNPPASATQSDTAAPAAYDPATFLSLISAQSQQGAGVTAPGGTSDHSHATGSASDSNDSDNATTQTIVNPDGSTTTIVTYGDGTEVESSTPAPQGTNAAASSAGQSSGNKALADLFQSLLVPAAGAALSALI
jgi:hypothetical protein